VATRSRARGNSCLVPGWLRAKGTLPALSCIPRAGRSPTNAPPPMASAPLRLQLLQRASIPFPLTRHPGADAPLAAHRVALLQTRPRVRPHGAGPAGFLGATAAGPSPTARDAAASGDCRRRGLRGRRPGPGPRPPVRALPRAPGISRRIHSPVPGPGSVRAWVCIGTGNCHIFSDCLLSILKLQSKFGFPFSQRT
jgi:hypothetical protein